MKVRSDFVSNSSSSSYIVAINADYSVKQFISDLVTDTLSNADLDDASEDFVEKVKESNLRNLNYHFNCTELLFLGTLRGEDTISTYTNDSDLDINDITDIAKNCTDGSIVIEEKSDDKVKVREKTYTSDITVLSECMEYAVGRYSFKQSYTDEERRHIAKEIYGYASAVSQDYNSLFYHLSSNLYQITKNTIANTRDLIFAGYDVALDKWQNLDELEARLDRGEKIFGIQLANGGDGMSDTTIFGFGGWSARIGNAAAFELLSSECC